MTLQRTKSRSGASGRPFSWLAPLILGLAASPSFAQGTLTTELVASGINSPVVFCQPPGESRMFVLSNTKGVYVIDNGVVQTQRYLDLSAEVGTSGEKALGMAFHPDYVNNGRMWVSYMDSAQNSHVVEYQRDATDPNIADVSTGTHIFGPTPQPSIIHNWYEMQFGPDGMLYLGFADGGDAWDPNDYAQDLTVTFGKILRIDVDAGGVGTYTIPASNPFAGVPGLAGEIWHYGLRNPYRFSFDRLTGDMWIGDVGQASWEEVDFAPAGSSALDFGWVCMEGFHCTSQGACGCGNPNWTPPVAEFGHTGGLCCMIGGYVYRGTEIPWLDGTYFYGDYCTGSIFTLDFDGTTASNFMDRSAEMAPSSGAINLITGFGQDDAGELYILDRAGGEVWKIKGTLCETVNYCTTSPNSAGTGALITTTGCSSLTSNDLVLQGSELPPNQFGIFFYGNQQTSSPFGQGTLCVGGTNGVFRLKPAIQTSATGTISRPLDVTAFPSNSGPGTINAGSTWNFQFWYRDPGLGFNLSDAIAVTFEP